MEQGYLPPLNRLIFIPFQLHANWNVLRLGIVFAQLDEKIGNL